MTEKLEGIKRSATDLLEIAYSKGFKDGVAAKDRDVRLNVAASEMYDLLNNIAWYIKATQKIQKSYFAADELFNYATRAEELLARIDGEKAQA